VDETADTIAQYIVDQLITSVTASVGMCHNVFLFYLCIYCSNYFFALPVH